MVIHMESHIYICPSSCSSVQHFLLLQLTSLLWYQLPHCAVVMAILTHIHKKYFVSFFTDKEVSDVFTGFCVILVSAGVNMAHICCIPCLAVLLKWSTSPDLHSINLWISILLFVFLIHPHVQTGFSGMLSGWISLTDMRIGNSHPSYLWWSVVWALWSEVLWVTSVIFADVITSLFTGGKMNAWKRAVQFFNALCTQELPSNSVPNLCLYIVWSDISWTELISPLISIVPFIVGFFWPFVANPAIVPLFEAFCAMHYLNTPVLKVFMRALFFLKKKNIIAYNVV